MRQRDVAALVESGALVALAAFGSAPICALAWRAVLGPADPATRAFDGWRAVQLLLKSGGIAAGASVLALLAGSAMGVGIARARARALTPLLFAMFAISPYVLALGWLGGRMDTAGARVLLGRPWAVAFVLGASFTPLAALALAEGLARSSVTAENAAFVFGGPRAALARVVLPQVRTVLAAVAVVVAGFALSDYSVASLLQVATYPVEIFLFEAGKFDPGAAARAALPLVACGALLALLLGALVPSVWFRRHAPARDAWPLTARARAALAGALAGALLFVAAPPVIGLLRGLPRATALSRVVASGAASAGNSVLIAAAAAAIVVVFGLPASARLVRLRGRPLVLVSAALLLPAFVPGSAFGIAWVELVALTGRSLAALGRAGPALCLAAEFGGLTAVLLAAVRSAMPAEPVEAARLFEPRPLQRWLKVEARLVLPAAAGLGGIVFALALNATAVLVLTVPPGCEVLPLRVDNLLHYGLADEAVALALLTALGTAGPALAGFALARRRP